MRKFLLLVSFIMSTLSPCLFPMDVLSLPFVIFTEESDTSLDQTTDFFSLAHAMYNLGIEPNDDVWKSFFNDGELLLHNVIINNNQGVFLSLLKCTEYININEQDNHQQTPLHLATEQGNLVFVYELLNNGADPFIKNASHHTALEIAEKKLSDEHGKCDTDISKIHAYAMIISLLHCTMFLVAK